MRTKKLLVQLRAITTLSHIPCCLGILFNLQNNPATDSVITARVNPCFVAYMSSLSPFTSDWLGNSQGSTANK